MAPWAHRVQVTVSPDSGSVKMAQAYGDMFGAGFAVVVKRRVGEVFVHFLFILEVALALAALYLVERWLGDIEMAAFDQFTHISVEESQ